MSAPVEKTTSEETPTNRADGSSNGVDAEFLAGMHAQRAVRVL